jgi:subtilase family serine protease
MILHHRPVRAGVVAVLGLGMTAAMGSLGSMAAAAAPTGPAPTVAIPNSVPATTDHQAGPFTSRNMTIQVALRPRNTAGLNRTMSALYTKGSGSFHHWLAKGQFNARYAPTAATRNAVASYLRHAGLTVRPTSSPFLVRASGPSAKVSAAFHTTLRNYTSKKGTRYYQNTSAVRLPAAIARSVQGVTGLTNTVRLHKQVMRPAVKPHAAAATCKDPYPTVAQQFALLDNGTGFPAGYGDGPGCSGLTPAQDNSIYGAPHLGASAQGKGVNIGLFELSDYQHSDIQTWAQTFFGKKYTAPLVDVLVDGGPSNPACPAGDQCPPEFNGFSGDIEVDADIEMQLAIAPAVNNVVVYNAPNDFTGQTSLDLWAAIANDDKVDSVSSSWGLCEQDAGGAGFVLAENTLFQQMAMQGQSVFGASGDTGAFDCIRSDGTTGLAVNDPPSQPFVTSVGGTSLESFNPGHDQNPQYPAGVESVWNTDALCSDDAPGPGNDNRGGFFWCARTGAGGGGSSMFWGRPGYQKGPGVNNPFTTHGNGSTQCQLAKPGTPCREVPDVSVNADEFTPYSEFCTGDTSTPFSVCAQFSGGLNPPGWFGIGGTSLSSPFWSAIVADRDSFHHGRVGLADAWLYRLFNRVPAVYFHDITGQGQTTRDNGFFPVTRGYDEAVGIGSPRMSSLILAGG